MTKHQLWESFLIELNVVLKASIGVGFIRAGGEFEVARETVITRGKCTLVVDGGANSGQWSKRLRKSFPLLPIYSFEPLSDPYISLVKASEDDSNWTPIKKGLGNSTCQNLMYVSSNESMSSSYKMPTAHLTEFGSVKFLSTELSSVVRLDSFVELLDESIYLKLDVQGSEWDAIEGCQGVLKNIEAIEVETTLSSMYEGDLTHYELIPRIIDLGFMPFAVSPAHRRMDGRCTYMDVILVRPSLLATGR